MVESPVRIVLVIVVLILSGASCATSRPEASRYEYSRVLMGVKARVILWSPDAESARDAARRAFDRIAELEGVISDRRDTSELSRLVAAADGRAHPVSADLFAVLERSVAVARETGGAFDVTVAPLIELWREARRSGELPSPRAVLAARRLVGWERIELDAAARSVRLRRRGTRLDLGGIGKGWACDEAVRALRAAGHPSCLVELGGDVSVGDPPPGRDVWRLGIGEDGDPVLELIGAAVATSGDTEQSIVIGGVRYSHIVDPETGLGLTDGLQVTVVAPSGADADALASAISVMGITRGLAFAEGRAHTEVLILRRTRDGMRAFRSSGFPVAQTGSAAR